MSLSRKFNLGIKRLLPGRLSRPHPARIDLRECRRILVLELWGLGDIVFAAPAVRALVSQANGAEVDILAQPSSRPLLELLRLGANPIYHKFPWTEFGNKYHPARYLNRAFWGLLRRLRSNRYDLVISVREDPRDAVLAKLLSPRHSLGFAAFGSPLFLTSSIATERVHKAEAWFRLLSWLGIGQSAGQAYLELRADIRSRLPAVARREKRIVLHCSARNPVRNWGLGRFLELGALLEKEGYGIIWLSDANSVDAGTVPGHWEKASGNLADILSLLITCEIYVSNDGGLMHMADLFGAKVCAVFGPTDPYLFYPYSQRENIVFLPEVACRPCLDYCIYPKPICFNGITAGEVRAKVLKTLSR